MIQRFFDWLTNQSDKKSSFSPEAPMPSAPMMNHFSNQPRTLPGLDLPEENIAQIIKEHLADVTESVASVQHLQEALSLASTNPSILSEAQKGSAILSLIGEEDSVFLIRLLRWKHGVLCPFCGAKDVRTLPHHIRRYKCLQCEGGEFNGEFDDLTGYFPKGDSHSARIWVLINYLKIFMPLSKIAKLLGLSLEQTLRIMSMMQPQSLAAKKRTSAHTSPVFRKT